MKKIILRGVHSDKFILIDNEDFEWLNQWKWSYKDGYAVRTIWPTHHQIRMHRLIMNTPKGMDTDHINGNGLDNRKLNLRICTTSQNLMNKTKKQNHSSTYKGVHWDKQMQKWRTNIYINHKQTFIGLFDKERWAAMAYDLWAKENYGKFAKLNFL